jgi:murein DD-endopeptidase MepM/ murein hydrolase activator NlpD
VAIAVATVLTALAPSAGASYRSRQEELERLIANKREVISDLTGREHSILQLLAESDQRRAVAQRNLDRVEYKLAVARTQLRRIETSLDATTIELHLKTQVLEQTLASLSLQQEVLAARVREIYMGSPSTFTKAFSLAEDFSDLVAANEYAVSVIRSDQQIVAEIQATKATIEAQRTDIEARQQVLATRRAEAAKVAQQIAAMVSERAAARGAILQEIARRNALLDQVRSRKSAYTRALNSLLAESRSIEALLRGAQRGQSVIQGRGGYLKWPVTGHITSGYGWRTHPIYGDRSFHTGIDIGAPSGRTVRAARYGRVLYTGYKGAYGLVVIIDHGNSLATIYAHLSRTYVRSGERVSTLESIGAVGSTGWSTGPHLHFEVRVNGQHQNPIRWL